MRYVLNILGELKEVRYPEEDLKIQDFIDLSAISFYNSIGISEPYEKTVTQCLSNMHHFNSQIVKELYKWLM